MTPDVKVLILFCVSLLISGCASTGIKAQNSNESRREIESAVGSVVSSIRGDKIKVKYCPLCGKHFGPKVDTCAKDGTQLLELEE